jgi:hypothetical protein
MERSEVNVFGAAAFEWYEERSCFGDDFERLECEAPGAESLCRMFARFVNGLPFGPTKRHRKDSKNIFANLVNRRP